jgi:hypothetical protein
MPASRASSHAAEAAALMITNIDSCPSVNPAMRRRT